MSNLLSKQLKIRCVTSDCAYIAGSIRNYVTGGDVQAYLAAELNQ